MTSSTRIGLPSAPSSAAVHWSFGGAALGTSSFAAPAAPCPCGRSSDAPWRSQPPDQAPGQSKQVTLRHTPRQRYSFLVLAEPVSLDLELEDRPVPAGDLGLTGRPTHVGAPAIGRRDK